MACPRFLSRLTATFFTLALVPLSWTAQSQFVVARNFPAGNFPLSTAVADFNGDGKLDIALLQLDNNQVIVTLNNGNGTFQAPKRFPTGILTPVSVSVADVNKDNKPDLVIFNSPVDGSPATVSILLGNGDGTFQSPKTVTIGSFPSVVAFADFSGDGRLDMVAANPGSQDPFRAPSLLILLGNGDGTFQPGQSIFVGSTPMWVAVGDFNNDGRADLAVANGTPQAISILLGNGDGTFKPANNFFGVGLPSFVAAEELDGDHNLDLMVGNTSNNTVAVLLGNGDGTFRTAKNFPAGVQPADLVIEDFNGDNKLDVAVRGSGPISVLLGNGDGTFGRPTLYDAGQAVNWLAAGDLLGDHKPDLIAVNSAKPGSLTFLKGKGDGTFLAARDFAALATPVGGVAGDFNGDGKPDLVFIAAFPNSLSVLLGNGDGTFRPPKTTPLPAVNSVATGDFNHDGKLDLAVTDTTNLSVDILIGNGDGTFQTTKQYPVSSVPFDLALGDFNHDGILDIIVATGLPGQGGDLNLLLGNSDGTFKSAAQIPFTGASQVVVGDFNRDGNLDFIVAQGSFTGLTLFLGKGDGTFQPPISFLGGGGSMLVTDLNNDRKLDLIVGAQRGNVFGLNVMLGNGDGTFQNAVFTPLPLHNPPFMAAEDFNRDGNMDLVASSFADSTMTLVLGNGKGGFQTPVVFATAMTPGPLIADDFNGDHAPDVAGGISGQAGTPGTGSVTILLNTGSRADPPSHK
jgi:hypothetical protein